MCGGWLVPRMETEASADDGVNNKDAAAVCFKSLSAESSANWNRSFMVCLYFNFITTKQSNFLTLFMLEDESNGSNMLDNTSEMFDNFRPSDTRSLLLLSVITDMNPNRRAADLWWRKSTRNDHIVGGESPLRSITSLLWHHFLQ